MFEVDGIEYDEADLPKQFHDLIPLMQRWCIADDLLRQEKQENAPKQELVDLIKRVEPRFEEICKYTDSVRQSLPDEPTSPAPPEEYIMMLLDALGVCTIEAKRLLYSGEATESLPQ